MINQLTGRSAWIKHLGYSVFQFLATMVLFCYLITFLPDSQLLDKSQTELFTEYLVILLTLDFGYSTLYGDPIWEILLDAGIKTLFLILTSIAFIILFTVPLSMFTAYNNDHILSRFLNKALFIISSVPILVVAIIIIALSVSLLGIVPELNLFYDGSNFQKVAVLTLPLFAIIIGDGILFSIFETLQDKIKKIKSEPWVKGIKARGGNINKHLVRGITESMIVSVTGKISFLISGIIVVELVFNWQGLGFILLDIFDQSSQRDYALLIAVMAFILLFVQTSGFIRRFTIMKMNPEKKYSSAV